MGIAWIPILVVVPPQPLHLRNFLINKVRQGAGYNFGIISAAGALPPRLVHRILHEVALAPDMRGRLDVVGPWLARFLRRHHHC